MVSGGSLSCRALLLGRLVALAASNAGVANTSSDLVRGAEFVELNSTEAEALDSDASGQEEASAFRSTGSETSALNSTEADASASNSTGAETSALNSTEAEALAPNYSMAEMLASQPGPAWDSLASLGQPGPAWPTWPAWPAWASLGQPVSSEPSAEAGGGTAEAPASGFWWAFAVDQDYSAWRWALALLWWAALAAVALLWVARARGRATRAAELQGLSSLDLEEGHPGGGAHSDGMKYALVNAAEPVAMEPLGARAAPLPVLLAPAAGPLRGSWKPAAAPPLAPRQPAPTAGLPAAAAPGARASARAQPAWQLGTEPVAAQGPFA